MKINIIGGGLAGSEAAWQLLKRGHTVELFEMRPIRGTDAHKTGNLAELVCSNSLKSLSENTGPGELKREMKLLNSLVIEAGEFARVPAGQALAVDREKFSAFIESRLKQFDGFTRTDQEVTELPTSNQLESSNEIWLVATGPLTSTSLSQSLVELCDTDTRLYFYDAIAPILSADTIDMDECFFADRYGKGDSDYINLPLSKEGYEHFIDSVIAAEKMPLHAFESTSYFESCLPIEVMIERGRETLRFGPMKPVGLVDPKTDKRPWANVQLRKENKDGTMYSMVGFQTKMKWPAQKEVFSQLPGLKNVEILRYGSVHRNTYIESPKVLNNDLSFRSNPRIFLAGQITGVEGYTESAAMGLLAALAIDAKAQNRPVVMPPSDTMMGGLYTYITAGCLGKFAPMNANLGLLPSLKRSKKISKAEKKQVQCTLAYEKFSQWNEVLV
ncbi:MAG: methylenetetrahydrofolate--tRNA-(uracil(54)-C(5))-methyltransferase (FADH(2)-oxidizing) TrmFO [Bdellovibrionota bacterium]